MAESSLGSDSRFNQLRQRLESLRSKRSHFDNQWEEAAERIIPAHVQSFRSRGFGHAMTPGRKNQSKLFDSTASLASQRFSAVMESLTVPRSQMWHRLVPLDDTLKKNRAVRLYMDELNSKLFRMRYRPSANFVGQVQQSYTGLGVYGNGLVFTDAQEDGPPGLRYKNLHLGEVYIVENHQGIVDTMFRAFFLTPGQIVSKYGEENVPKAVRTAADSPNRADEELEILHVIRPRKNFDPNRIDALGLPFESLHFFVQEGKLLRESGYRTFPLAMSRYIQYTNETYGRGPAQIVLPSIKVLSEEKKTVIKQGHRIVDPVLLAHDDGAVGAFSLKPGAINAGGVNSQGRALIQPLPTGNLAVGKELMDDERVTINDAFLITLFQILVDNGTMTATEVVERAREKGMLLAPTAARLESEFLGPMIERELDVLDQLGLLPPPPSQLLEAGGEFAIEYDNPMARMVRAENAAGFMRSLETALNFATTTQDPRPLDWFNFDEAMPDIMDINGAPVKWTNTVEAVQRIRAERAQQVQQQQVIDAAPSIAALAKAESERRDNG